jgi:hypothetical protein
MATFRVVPALNAAMAETNAIYVNPREATTPYARVGRFIYKAIPHPDVIMGTICMNAITRRAVYPSELVTLEEFIVPLTALPPSIVCVRAEYVKRMAGPMPENLANTIRNVLEGNIVSLGQKFTLTHDHPILLEVTDVDSFGILNANTELSVMWVPCL